ncbi:unnamed protein product, partial [marine sediment metagenome]
PRCEARAAEAKRSLKDIIEGHEKGASRLAI